ncbi:hypothetical protein DY000_02011775 [Brassica cretica]|uniref:Uncharacterized protein n=1 Tax=Brassica cretica TaxID=69181 RepID=A0ABQ7D481_BRACR|nr:hypothetical protein DY000_02011775 [Brassica cretica]
MMRAPFRRRRFCLGVVGFRDVSSLSSSSILSRYCWIPSKSLRRFSLLVLDSLEISNGDDL